MLSSLFFPSKTMQLNILRAGYVSRKLREIYLKLFRGWNKILLLNTKNLSHRSLWGWREPESWGLPMHPSIMPPILLLPGELSTLGNGERRLLSNREACLLSSSFSTSRRAPYETATSEWSHLSGMSRHHTPTLNRDCPSKDRPQIQVS